MKQPVDLIREGIYRVKNGKLEKIKNPESGFGKQTIYWQDGKITNVEVSYTEK